MLDLVLSGVVITSVEEKGPGRCATRASWCFMVSHLITAGRGSSIGSVSAWHASSPEFNPYVRHMKTFLRPFSHFRCFQRTAQCQLLAKECALSTGKLPRRLAQEQCGKGNWPRPKWPKMCWRAVKQKSNQSVWAASWQNNKLACAPSEDSDQPGHPTQSDQSSLTAWRNLGSLATHWAHSEDSDQRLIWVFAGRTCQYVGFVTRRLI